MTLGTGGKAENDSTLQQTFDVDFINEENLKEKCHQQHTKYRQLCESPVFLSGDITQGLAGQPPTDRAMHFKSLRVRGNAVLAMLRRPPQRTPIDSDMSALQTSFRQINF